MFLKYIRLKNVRCFDDLELSFTNEDGSIRKWTIILGENGTGKSNLLQAIGLVTAGSDALSDLLGEPNSWIKYKKDFCEIDAVLVTKGDQERKLKLRINRDDDRSEVIYRNKESLAAIDSAIDYADRNYFIVGFGTYRRLNLNNSRRSKVSRFYQKRAENVSSLFDNDAVLTPLESWAMDLDYLKDKAGIDIVRKALDNFMPGVSFSHIEKQEGKLYFKTMDGIVPLQLLSDGYQNMAAWIGDLLYRITETFKDYKSPFKARGLLLIDEIALHLHIKWQRNLLYFINQRLPNFQLIVTTHSPITAQQADVGELHYLEREKQKIILNTFSGNPKNLLLHQLITADAFGLDSDESRDVEVKKEKYKKMRDKKGLSKTEKLELKKMRTELDEIPIQQRGNLIVQKKHIDLIKKIEQEFAEKTE